MPRKRRIYLPNYPQHVVVRGHNRDPVLAHVDDFRFLYKCLYDAASKHGLAGSFRGRSQIDSDP